MAPAGSAGLDGGLGFDDAVAEGCQGRDDVSIDIGRHDAAEFEAAAEFVLQREHELLGGLLADALDAAEHVGLLVDDRAPQHLR